jgi:Uma2 family endonuclease
MKLETFWAEYAGKPFEFIDGEPVAKVQKGYLHEMVTSRVLMYLSLYVETHNLGEVFGDGTRFAISEHDLRAADVAYVTGQSLAKITDPESFLPFPPDLVIEVVSPRFTSTQIQQKMDAFLDAGAKAAWVVDPEPKEITILYPDGKAATFAAGNTVQADGMIPGLTFLAEDLFPPLGTQLDYLKLS